ncbi:MAG: hypothetical protein CMM50_09005 [Rhodospirillaceae bacterium]|nr:hypothetical protein [Rhodospirillaceae bacterium]
MTTFNDRERDAERKFEHDKELEFKIVARRNKLLGLWAAEQMGISGQAAEAYAKEVVVSDFQRPGDDDVLEKVFGDLKSKGIETTEHKVRLEMDRLRDKAREQVMAE